MTLTRHPGMASCTGCDSGTPIDTSDSETDSQRHETVDGETDDAAAASMRLQLETGCTASWSAPLALCPVDDGHEHLCHACGAPDLPQR